jgi:hypothetical protein
MLEYQAKRWNIEPSLSEQKSCIRVNILVHLWVKTIDTTNYLNRLKIFGCVMFVCINKYKIKWSPTSLCCVFICYDFCQNGCFFIQRIKSNSSKMSSLKMIIMVFHQLLWLKGGCKLRWTTFCITLQVFAECHTLTCH